MMIVAPAETTELPISIASPSQLHMAATTTSTIVDATNASRRWREERGVWVIYEWKSIANAIIGTAAPMVIGIQSTHHT